MTWSQRYFLRFYLRDSVWIWPFASALVALVTVQLLHQLELRLGWQSALSPETSRLVLGTLASSMFTFIVYVSSALLVAMQLASAQLTPRIIGIVFRDTATKACLVAFVFTFAFCLATLVRIESTVSAITANLAAYGCLVSLGVFLFLIGHVGRMLRPSGAMATVARLGRAVIADVYPRRLGESRDRLHPAADFEVGVPTRTVLSTKEGVIVAFDLPGLVALAQRAQCVVELVPQVGDFVAIGTPLFRIYRGGSQITDEMLLQSLAVQQERTIEQDPAFAIRIIVDIACKGLSPAINDPTTAVLALDQIHHLLGDLGQRNLDDERVFDAEGTVRVLYRTPGWQDYVQLAVTEIRHFGGGSIQVVRRLRAMLENLEQTLPEQRSRPLQHELTLVHRAGERFFAESADRALASQSDTQGVGGNPNPGPDSRDTPEHPAP